MDTQARTPGCRRIWKCGETLFPSNTFIYRARSVTRLPLPVVHNANRGHMVPVLTYKSGLMHINESAWPPLLLPPGMLIRRTINSRSEWVDSAAGAIMHRWEN